MRPTSGAAVLPLCVPSRSGAWMGVGGGEEANSCQACTDLPAAGMPRMARVGLNDPVSDQEWRLAGNLFQNPLSRFLLFGAAGNRQPDTALGSADSTTCDEIRGHTRQHRQRLNLRNDLARHRKEPRPTRPRHVEDGGQLVEIAGHTLFESDR